MKLHRKIFGLAYARYELGKRLDAVAKPVFNKKYNALNSSQKAFIRGIFSGKKRRR